LLGEESTTMLVYLLENTPPQPLFKILPIELVVRESTLNKVDEKFFERL